MWKLNVASLSGVGIIHIRVAWFIMPPWLRLMMAKEKEVKAKEAKAKWVKEERAEESQAKERETKHVTNAGIQDTSQ